MHSAAEETNDVLRYIPHPWRGYGFCGTNVPSIGGWLSMKDVFPSFFAPTDEERKSLWDECIFVFDTNVLTTLYKCSDETRNALYKVVESLGGRLWIPHQVAFEFLNNRANVISSQSKLYADSAAALKDILTNLEHATRHPFISDEVFSEFKLVSSKVVSELSSKKDFHDSRIVEDDVKHQVSELLLGKVGSGYDNERLQEIVKGGESRYTEKTPPGFKDVGKFKDSKVFGEVCARYGDLIIWYQVIDKAIEAGKSVIMVTGDQKEDWWEIASGKTLGPLPALVAEFKQKVGKVFYLYSTHQFLRFANDYLNQGTSSEVISEVEEVATSEAAALTVDPSASKWFRFDNGRYVAWTLPETVHGEYAVLQKSAYELRMSHRQFLAEFHQTQFNLNQLEGDDGESSRAQRSYCQARIIELKRLLENTTSSLASLDDQIRSIRSAAGSESGDFPEMR